MSVFTASGQHRVERKSDCQLAYLLLAWNGLTQGAKSGQGGYGGQNLIRQIRTPSEPQDLKACKVLAS